MKIFSSLSIGIIIVMIRNIVSQNGGSDNTDGDNKSNSEIPTFVCKADQSNIEIVNDYLNYLKIFLFKT